MFLRYYGFHEQPFGMTPDPRFLYLSASHREALASLIYGIEAGRGFVSLIARPGMGKTTVLFQLMERLRNSARTAFLFQTQGTTRELLANLIADLGIDPADRDLGALQRQLNETLIQEARLGRQFILVIDEAQNLDDSVLESVRMLSNFETSRSKLIQIVLAGQPGLAEKLARPGLEQLRQRISILCELSPLSPEEVAEYISHRLKTAGYTGLPLFTDESLMVIAERSEGIPRNVNNMCFHALSLAYAKGLKSINRAIIEEVLIDLKLDTQKDHHENPWVQQAAGRRQSSILEDVSLNHDRRYASRRELLRGGSYSSSTARREGVSRGRPPIKRNPAWLVWSVAALVLVLAGEVVWALMPSGMPPQVVSKIVANTVGQAEEAASKYGPLKMNNSLGQQEPQTTVIHTDANAGPQAESQPTSLPDSADSRNGASNSNPPASGNEKAIEPTDDGNPLPTGAGAGEPPEKAVAGGRLSRQIEYSPSPEQVPKGKVVIESNISGSAITINGQSNPDWVTPHVFDLPQGTYRISVSREPYSTWFKIVQVSPGHKSWISAELQPPKGVIVIDTQPPGMQVFIDGKPYGPSEVEAQLSVGSHTFKVIPPLGKRPLEGSFVLKPGDVITRTIRWLPSAGVPAADATPETQEPRNAGNSLKEKERS